MVSGGEKKKRERGAGYKNRFKGGLQCLESEKVNKIKMHTKTCG